MTFKVDRTINLLSTMRGRVGYLVTPNTLVFGTGGAAFAQADFTVSASGGANTVTTQSTTLRGVAFGAGFEHAFSPRMSFKADYLYVDFDRRTWAKARVRSMRSCAKS